MTLDLTHMPIYVLEELHEVRPRRVLNPYRQTMDAIYHTQGVTKKMIGTLERTLEGTESGRAIKSAITSTSRHYIISCLLHIICIPTEKITTPLEIEGSNENFDDTLGLFGKEMKQRLR